MAGIPNGDSDERIAEALNGALIEGEEVVAREMGDQGQAIALTQSRIIVIKVGLAASGELNGQKASAFTLDAITSINLRKGPLGAIIQICEENPQSLNAGGPPDNVIVFTGPGRVRRAEAFASTIESITGKTVNRLEPSHATPKAGREPRALADEIYNEVVQSQQAEQTEETQTPAIESVEPVVEEQEPEPDPQAAFNPNPRLPKPVRKRNDGPNRVLVFMGITAALVFIGMAIMAPMREAQNAPSVTVNQSDYAIDVKSILLQQIAVSSYYKKITHSLCKSNEDAASFSAAIRNGSKSAIRTGSCSTGTDNAWQEINALSTPPGLAAAKENLVNGLVVRKNAIVAAAAAAESIEPIDVKETLSQLSEADTQIKKGLAAIIAAKASLEKQTAAKAKHAK